MSTDVSSRRGGRARRRRRGFTAAFAIVLGVLVVVGGAAGAVVAVQGPRVTSVQFDPQAAVSASGSRLILTTSQALADVYAAQVTVSPKVETTVSTSGRAVGIRFALPLFDDTTYTVTVSGVRGVGGGPAATLTETFRTPGLQVYMLQRSTKGDTVYRTGLEGSEAVPVFTHPHIEDFRATASALVMSVRTDDDLPELIATDPDGENARTLKLPGDGTGTVQELQSADRGDLVGYTYTDADMAAGGGQASVLYTASLKAGDADAEPTPIRVGEDAVSAASWRFVPDTDRVLVLSFEGRLLLAPPDGSDVVDLGDAAAISGIARGSTTAVIVRADGLVEVDLADGTATPLATAAGVDGYLGTVVPLPDGETLQQFTTSDATTVYRVGTDGTARATYSASGTEALLQTCVSPSGRYGAFLMQPDAASNPYRTGYDLPVPKTVNTHIIDLDDGTEVSALGAFAISWCQVPLS
jgi:hypothetical protein